MRYLLDTSTFIWAMESPDQISRRAMTVLQKEDAHLELSSVSIAEIAIKQSVGKLQIEKRDVLQGIGDLKLRILAYNTDHACEMFDLPLHHTDPFDRQLIAQAVFEGIPILTSDVMFKRYKNVQVIW